MPFLRPLASLWVGEPLSFIEAACLSSWVQLGHEVTLYSDDVRREAPDGVRVADCQDLMPLPNLDAGHDGLKARVVYADLFRLELIARSDCLWVDADAYGIKPLDFASHYVFGRSPHGRILTGILGLARGSKTLSDMRDFLGSLNPIPPWMGPTQIRRNLPASDHWTLNDLPWGVSGPAALDHFLKQNHEDHHALPSEAFYPRDVFDDGNILLRNGARISISREDTYSLHILGFSKRTLRRAGRRLPPKGSILKELCRLQSINPTDWPIPEQALTPKAA